MFTTRFATAAALLAVCIAALFFLPNGWWTVLLLPILLAASWEWSALARFNSTARGVFAAVVLASALLLWLAYPAGTREFRYIAADAMVYGLGCAFWLVLVPLWLAGRWRAHSPLALGGAGWLVLVPAWLALARLQPEPERLLAVLGIVWLSDTAAYLAGSAWGRRKLAPAISPGKSWEGVAGACAAVAVYYVVLSSITPGWPWWRGLGGVALFAGVVLTGIVGDLFESWIKRQAGMKDSGALLPGHGGILDRIDSMTASLPFAALLLPHIS
jgi:phosphatidate cytidylyltransferase